MLTDREKIEELEAIRIDLENEGELVSNQTGDQHRAQGATVWQAPDNWEYFFSPQCERNQMNKMQFVETTRERYEDHVAEYNILTVHGGRVDIQRVEVDEWRQVKVYHNPAISDIGQTPRWFLVAFALYDLFADEHSQFFILEEVTMGVTTTQIGLNGLSEAILTAEGPPARYGE